MTAKEFLNRYIQASEAIDDKLTEIAQLRALSTKVSVAFNPDRVQSSGNTDSMSAIVAKIVDMGSEIDADIDKLREIKREIMTVIMDVPNHKQRRILYHRYILGKTWEQIAEKLDNSRQWVCIVHGQALTQIKFQ